MPGYKWNGFMARLTTDMRYPNYQIKLEKVKKKTYDENGVCIFCKICNEDCLIYFDEDVAVFKDIKQDAVDHFLVIPRLHIPDLNSLGELDLNLIAKMKKIGMELLEKNYPGQRYRIGFHHPPRNSIGHLHMHCIVLPFKSLKSKISYSDWFWFITPEELIKKIKNTSS